MQFMLCQIYKVNSYGFLPSFKKKPYIISNKSLSKLTILVPCRSVYHMFEETNTRDSHKSCISKLWVVY